MARHEWAIVKTYDELVRTLYARAEHLDVTRLSLDEVGGLPSGYSGKLLGARRVKTCGAKSLFPLLGALGLALALVEDPEARRRHSSRLQPRRKNWVRNQHSAAA
jgi:hypothetical protein